jgi:hypothetical protein
MTSTYLVSAATPKGNNRRIELAGMDLWISACIDNVFVYPSEIKLDKLKEALSRTLSLWPFVAGRILLENDQHYIIEMCDNPIPIKFVINNDLEKWPLNSTVILEGNNEIFPIFIDKIEVTKLFNNICDEPLVRLKLTQIVQSNEWVLGISWYHLLGDAAACLHFSNTLSRFYQQLEPIEPLPIFERRLWHENEAERSIFPIPKQFLDAQPLEEILKILSNEQLNYTPLILPFSSEQLSTLRRLAGGNNVTIQDALTAYIVLTLNKYCYNDNDERRILHTITVVNFRGISDLIAPQGHVSNSLFMMLSDNFDNPYSLSNIAKTIRQSIIRLRHSETIEAEIAKIDGFMRDNVKNNKTPNPKLIPNEIAINSNYKYDWANLVDFGYTDKSRFYTTGTRALYLRVFRLNPIKDGDQWLPRDTDGAELSFRIETHLKDKFLNAWKRDITENFQNINI